jgi:hypothetical protein
MRKFRLLLLIILAAGLFACSASTEPDNLDLTPDDAWYNGLNQTHYGAYHVTFLIQFEGEYAWSYQLDTRANGQVTEQMLHLEGPNKAQNLGDVRLVSQAGINQMRGAGTEDLCLQYPSGFNLGPAFLTPDDLISPATVSPMLTAQYQETIAGVEAQRYSFRRAELENWRDIQVDMWWDDDARAVLRYDLSLHGTDPLFDAGLGTLTALYEVNTIGPQEILPVEGCEVGIPLPETAANLVKLPDLIAFESPVPAAEVVTFFLKALPAAGWVAQGDILEGENAVLLNYSREEETLSINIEQRAAGVTVELFPDS